MFKVFLSFKVFFQLVCSCLGKAERKFFFAKAMGMGRVLFCLEKGFVWGGWMD